MSEISVLIGERIRECRKANGLTLQQLADKINRSKSTLSKYESGAISVDMDTLAAISAVLKTHVYTFIDGIGETAEEFGSKQGGAPKYQGNQYVYGYEQKLKFRIKAIMTE